MLQKGFNTFYVDDKKLPLRVKGNFFRFNFHHCNEIAASKKGRFQPLKRNVNLFSLEAVEDYVLADIENRFPSIF